jgi:hypothetical protein
VRSCVCGGPRGPPPHPTQNVPRGGPRTPLGRRKRNPYAARYRRPADTSRGACCLLASGSDASETWSVGFLPRRRPPSPACSVRRSVGASADEGGARWRSATAFAVSAAKSDVTARNRGPLGQPPPRSRSRGVGRRGFGPHFASLATPPRSCSHPSKIKFWCSAQKVFDNRYKKCLSES